MDFELKEEQKIFREAIIKFTEKEVMPFIEEAEEKETFPVHIFRRLGELGYLGVHVPEEDGGAGQGKMEEVILCEELARVCAGIAASLNPQLACMYAISRFGSEGQKQTYLRPAVKGEKIIAIGITEANAGSDVAGIQTTARHEKGGWLINGNKMFITNGTFADTVVTAAYLDKSLRHEGLALFLIDRDTPGFFAHKLKKMSVRSSETAELIFEDCWVPEKALLGGERGGFQKVIDALTSVRITHAARSLGIARAAYEAAYKYARQRNQFGKLIHTFQAVRFKLVDMAVQIEAAKWLVYHAAWLADNDKEYAKEVSMAKLFASEAALHATAEAMQIHGGYGLMLEYPVQRYFRDARLAPISDGTSEIQRIVIARSLDL